MAKKSPKKRRRHMQSSIAEHKRDRKKLITPLNALPNVHPTDWPRDQLPELLWFAAMLDEYKRPEAALRILEVLEPFAEDATKFDGHVSTFAAIPSEKRSEALDALDGEDVPPLPDGLGHGLSLYPECPAGWLYSRWNERNEIEIERGLDYLKGLVAEHYASRTEPATKLRFAAIGWLVRRGRIHVSEEWIEKSNVPKYPGDLTEDERRGAESEIRAMYGALRAADAAEGSTEFGPTAWAEYFWRQSHRVSVCEFATTPRAASEDETTDEAADTEPVRVRDIRSVLVGAGDALGRELAAAQARVEIDLYAPEASEVKLGLASRQVRLLQLVFSDPHLWDASAGTHVLRALVDTLIVSSWLLQRGDPELYLRFRAFGLGRLKLYKLHLETYLDEHDDPSEEQLDFLEALDEEVNSELFEMFTDIDLGGTFAGIGIRDMAKEAQLDSYYNLAYQPYSSEAHGDWISLRRSDLVHCQNPLHRFHRVGRFDDRARPLRLEVIEAAIEVTAKTVTAVFSDVGVDVEGSFERLRKQIFAAAQPSDINLPSA